MSRNRNNFEIPEVFRKAMEDAGWDLGNNKEDDEGGNSGGDGGNGRNRPPFPRNPTEPQRPNRIIWLLGLFFLLLLSLNWIVTTYTEWLWFTELSYQNVWLKRWGVQVLSFVVSFALAAAVLLLNWRLARRRASKSTPSHYPQFLQFSGFNWLINGVGLFFAFVFASAAASQWESILLYLNQVPFNISDPLLGQDISFYLFTLPIYQFLQGWFSSLLLFTILGLLFIYFINYLPDIQRGRWQTPITQAMRQHTALLIVLFLGLWAISHWLDIYNLLYSEQGVVFGASYTDMNANLYGLWAQVALMGLTAAAVAFNIFRQNLRLPLMTAALWLAASFILGGVYPNLLQRYAVEPNEIVRESPYIQHNITYTRLAFGLDQIESKEFIYGGELTQEDLIDNEISFRNIRLWDYRPLQATYEQLQALRPYYEFSEIDIDRYIIDGEQRQVMLAVRELNKTKLPNRTWVNENLEFTHGYGLVMNPVDQVTRDGRPEFYIKDLPPVSSISVQIDRPEIYYGELTNDVVFVGSDRDEFSYPSGDENVYSSYAGTGGVPLDSALKRLAFALRLADTNVMLSDEITRETRVQFHREISQRVKQVTPFLTLDSDPYIVAWNGRLIWILDAYTVSGRFPYATRINGINYIRNAAKVTVDAYDGNVTYYITAPDDPIIQAYSSAFPGLFQPLSAMPEGLQAHLRYPEDLFTIQMQQYLTYHMQDVRVFYNQEDRRAFPNEILNGQQTRMEPYYVVMPLPGGETEPEFLLIQPFTPANKPNMVSWIAARNDPPYYGQLVEYELPKQELIFGPIQVEGRIDQEPEISEQFSLWNRGGSSVLRGNLIIIPVNDSFVYVEPVYLQSSTSALPELKRVIVATNTRIAMRDTLAEALLAIIEGAPAVAAIEVLPAIDSATGETVTETAPAPTPVAPPPIVAGDATLETLIQSANDHFNAAEAAQRRGDWSAYGTELEALQQDLQRLLELANTAP